MCLGKGGGGGEGCGREGGGGRRGGAPAITSVDRLLSVFTQTRGVLQRVNILITAPTSRAVSESEVPELSRPRIGRVEVGLRRCEQKQIKNKKQ